MYSDVSPEPVFIDAQLIPDGSDPNDAKLYFFLRERLTDHSGNTNENKEAGTLFDANFI